MRDGLILYIHGFASCGLGNKSRLLARHFGESRVLAPDLPHGPLRAIAFLEDLLARQPVGLLVGSSLGGYYATWLKRRHDVPAVLINPAIAPYLLLEDYLGTHEGCRGERFVVDRRTLRELRGLYRPQLRQEEAYLVLLQTGDEVLDYRRAAAYYAGKDVIIEQGGNHRFENLSDHLPRIEAWIRRHEQEDQTTA